MMGWVLRTFKTRDSRPMLALYKAVVFLYLEYCSQVWSHMTLENVRKLEGVQRTFTPRLKGMHELNYW